jgi:hypothetical protein
LLANTTDVPRSRACRAGASPGPPGIGVGDAGVDEDTLLAGLLERFLERERSSSFERGHGLLLALRGDERRCVAAIDANRASAVDDGVKRDRRPLAAIGVVCLEEPQDRLPHVSKPQEDDSYVFQ